MGRGIAGVLSPLRQPARPGVRPGNYCHAGRGAADGDTVVKIDSDTVLLSGGWVREMKHNGLALHAAGYRVPGTRPNGPPTEIATP